MPKVSEEYKIQKHAQIMENAFRCFAAKGYQSTTVDDIAKESGIGKGVIYDYFKSKEEILLQIMEDHGKQFFAELEQMLIQIPEPLEKLKTVFKKFKTPPKVDTIDKFRVFMEFWIYCSRNPQLDHRLLNRHHKFVELLMKILKQGQENGTFNQSVDPKTVSSLLWSIRDGAFIHYFLLRDNQLNLDIWTHTEDMLLKQLCE